MVDAARQLGRLPARTAIEISSMPTAAVMVDVNEQAWIEICLRRSVPGPILIRQGLPVTERPVIRELVPAL